jgi:hypothetical protein
MFRLLLALALALVATTSGCRVCSSPYDYCGPVFSEGMCRACDTDYRAGSKFTGGPQPAGAIEAPPENVPTNNDTRLEAMRSSPAGRN